MSYFNLSGKNKRNQALPCVDLDTNLTEKVTISGTSAQNTTAFTGVVRIISTTNCYYQTGSNPTATNAKVFLPANVAEYLYFETAKKIAFIQDVAGGSGFITPALKE